MGGKKGKRRATAEGRGATWTPPPGSGAAAGSRHGGGGGAEEARKGRAGGKEEESSHSNEGAPLFGFDDRLVDLWAGFTKQQRLDVLDVEPEEVRPRASRPAHCYYWFLLMRTYILAYVRFDSLVQKHNDVLTCWCEHSLGRQGRERGGMHVRNEGEWQGWRDGPAALVSTHRWLQWWA
eukprot:GHVU01125997.1.p1 GENE.GHVU01125997.1~~GHVU01125997.1.p1  ORF type:complete len:179 (+),score=24.38 GHVU01125997.1:400-936(+)